jgi:hypothetical protein
MTPLVPCSLTRVAHSRTLTLKRQVLGSTSEFARLRGNVKLKLVTSWYFKLADLVAWICLVSVQQ